MSTAQQHPIIIDGPVARPCVSNVSLLCCGQHVRNCWHGSAKSSSYFAHHDSLGSEFECT